MISQAAFMVTFNPSDTDRAVPYQSSLQGEEITLAGFLLRRRIQRGCWRNDDCRCLLWMCLWVSGSSLFRRCVCLPLHESACHSQASDEPYLPAFHTPCALAISPAVAVPTALVSSPFLSPGTKSQRRLFVSPLWQPYNYKLIIGLLVLDSFSPTVTCNNQRGAITVSTHLVTDFSI